MGKLSKLIGMASKALDKNGGPGSGQAGQGSGDWRSMVRSAADALTGDGRGAEQTRPADPYAAPAGSYAPPAGPSAPPAQHRPAPTGPDRYAPPPAGAGRASGAASLAPADRAAIARYDYLLQTADPHQIEQIHREAFARLTPEQRAHVQARMNAELPAHERPRSTDPAELARTAARAEASRPGMLTGLLARVGGSGGRGGSGMRRLAGGAALGASVGVLGAVAGGAILSSVAGPMLDAAAGIDFDAIGANLDVEGLAGGVEGLAGDALGGVGEQVSGFGEQVSGVGEQFGGFDLGGIGDFFGR